jgi:7-cyano-7-deazaguanine synthase
MESRCVLLLSGGLDSSTCAALAIRDGFEPHALTFRYGQRHAIELDAARAVAASLGIRHHVVVEIDLGAFGGSALTGGMAVPKGRRAEEMSRAIPATYVPARNTIFLSFALAYAEALNCGDIYLGVNAVDYSGYPDCRPEYIASFEKTANLATRIAVEGGVSVKIHAPLIHLGKSEIIRLGRELGVDYSLTHSCYDPTTAGEACGECDSCLIRMRGFEEAGVPDPTRYASRA